MLTLNGMPSQKVHSRSPTAADVTATRETYIHPLPAPRYYKTVLETWNLYVLESKLSRAGLSSVLHMRRTIYRNGRKASDPTYARQSDV
jgi:hypothetical protein